MARKTIERILTGIADRNIKFDELRKVLFGFDFNERIKGSHHIFTKDDVVEIINIQPLKGGLAKPYQVKQVRNLILKYKLHEGE